MKRSSWPLWLPLHVGMEGCSLPSRWHLFWTPRNINPQLGGISHTMLHHAAGVLDLLVLQGNAWMYYDVLYIEEKVRRYIHACMRASINRLPLHGILLNSNNCNTIQYNTPEYARIQYKYKTIHTIQHNADTIRQYNTTQLTIQHTTICHTNIGRAGGFNKIWFPHLLRPPP